MLRAVATSTGCGRPVQFCCGQARKHSLTPAAASTLTHAPSATRGSPFLTLLPKRLLRNTPTPPSASSASEPAPQPASSNNNGGGFLLWGLLALAVAAGVAATVTGQAGVLKDVLVNGPLGKSGFAAAFSLIFLSEIGDKTFFIAAILAMRLGRWVSFLGSIAALSVMTVISVAIGVVIGKVPDALKSSIPVGEIAGVALLVFFGIKALRDATKKEEEEDSDGELADAESAVKEAEKDGKVSKRGNWASFIEVGSLIFVAEWGDRSMLATIALGAAQNPVGVAVGAIVGHSIATAIAVVGGAIAGKYISEKTINLISGVLFLLFAAATAYSLL